LDSGSVFEMDVETIRVVIVSMYLKMIRTLCLTQLEYGTTRELKPVAAVVPMRGWGFPKR